MLLTSKIPMVMLAAVGFAGPFATQTGTPEKMERGRVERPALIELQPGVVRYRVAGDFTRAGKPAEAPLVTARIERPIGFMRTQVTAGEYQQCVADGACKAPGSATAAIDHPVVQVSWHDANDYANWLSRRTGVTWRLPTDEEWAYAAGSRWRDDGIAVDASDPSRRWLARYEREATLKETAAGPSEPQPVGSFGANENGVADLAGNVWEWTSTCFTRVALDEAGRAATVNCGVRVVEGQHRSYVTDFIRDARAGGCAAGIPPTNLGFRLVADRGNTLPALVASVLRTLRSAILVGA
jgi:formylglycine-generating enzyme required for sulfatase activity